MKFNKAVEILKENNYKIVKKHFKLSERQVSEISSEEFYDRINKICDKYDYAVIDSEDEDNAYDIFVELRNEDIRTAPHYDEFMKELKAIPGFDWDFLNDRDKSFFTCWQKVFEKFN